MSRIWKYPVKGPNFELAMPQGARVLTVQVQHGEPVLWALVDPEKPHARRAFLLIGTGHDFDATGLNYVGTFQEGPFVWHLFEEPPF